MWRLSDHREGQKSQDAYKFHFCDFPQIFKSPVAFLKLNCRAASVPPHWCNF